jgi:Fe-S cluster assembly ATP-binding protein
LLIYPKLAILDEIDSGLDTEGLKMVAEVVGEMKQKGTSFVLITHNKRVLEDIEVDNTWEMKHGQLQARV